MTKTTPHLAAVPEELAGIPPDCTVDAREGVSADEVAKIRLWHLQAQSQNIMRQTVLADTKAATLLALIGLVATKVAIELPETGIGLFAVLLFANKAAVLCLCLHVIMPRFPAKTDWPRIRQYERYSWAGLANPTDDQYDYGSFARDAKPSHIFTSIARANQGAARVLLFKFKWLRLAFLLAIVDVVLTLGYFFGGGLAA